MSIQVFGMAVSRGVAIGKAVLIASSRVDVAHYFVAANQVDSEIERLRGARNAVAAELTTLHRDLPAEAPAELSALLDAHPHLWCECRSRVAHTLPTPPRCCPRRSRSRTVAMGG